MQLLTISLAATQLSTSRRTVEREIADGKLAEECAAQSGFAW
jgi:hypothetical protein